MTGLTILLVILAVIVVFVVVILIRTALFKPYAEPEMVEEKVNLNED